MIFTTTERTMKYLIDGEEVNVRISGADNLVKVSGTNKIERVLDIDNSYKIGDTIKKVVGKNLGYAEYETCSFKTDNGYFGKAIGICVNKTTNSKNEAITLTLHKADAQGNIIDTKDNIRISGKCSIIDYNKIYKVIEEYIKANF